MRIFITGGTGFVGRRLIRDLLDRGHEPVVLCRAGSEEKLETLSQKVRAVIGGLHDREAILAGIDGTDAVVYLAGILREFPRTGSTFKSVHVEGVRLLSECALSRGVQRFIHMSALGAHSRALSRYHQSKYEGEDLVRRSDLVYTIFRPSVIFGPGDAFVNLLAGMISRTPIVPVVGSGRYKMQPVALENVTAAIVESLANPKALYKTYPMGGPEALSYNEILDTIGRVLGRRRRKIHVPPGVMWAQATLLDRLPFFPITRDQLLMLLDDNVAEDDSYTTDLGITPTRFEEGIRRYLKPE